MKYLDRITRHPDVMGGRPCIRQTRMTVAMVLGNLAAGASASGILKEYPDLEQADILACLEWAALRASERELPLAAA